MQAVHFHCDVQDAPMVSPELQWLYSSTGDGNHLLGIKLCLIPDITKMINLLTKVKGNRLRNLQVAFDKYIVWIFNWEITDLDSMHKSDGKSLRQMINSLKSRKNNIQSCSILWSNHGITMDMYSIYSGI